MLKNSFIYTSQFSVFIHTQINKRLKLKYCYAKNATSFPGPFPGLGAGEAREKALGRRLPTMTIQFMPR